jgi:hypothetical protein
MRPLLASAALLFLAVSSVYGQTPFGITAAQANRAGTQVSVRFSDPLADVGPHTQAMNVTIEGAPQVTINTVSLTALAPRMVITLLLSQALPPSPTRVCFSQVAYIRADAQQTTTAPVCAAVVTDNAAIDAVKAAALKVLTDTPATPDEKVLNASGFVTTASDGTEGGGDISFNPKLSDPNASAFVRLKKATVEKGDARHFEVGAAYRRGVPWNRTQLARIAAAPDVQTLQQLMDERQSAVIAGTIVNFALKLEGDPSTFDATNGVGEADYSIVTMTKPLFGKSGFWRSYGIPGGLEIGRKLGVDGTGAATTEHDWIARYKAGAGIKVFFKGSQASLVPITRFDFAVDGIWRYLAFEELNFNTTTKALDKVTDGAHGYIEASLKAFFVETGKQRFGIKGSYIRGSLPPVFADVKSFQFGFVVESNDKD